MLENFAYLIVGAILGWLFPEWSRSRHEKKEKAELIKNIKTTIRVEIDQNLKRLTDYRDKLEKIETSEKYRQEKNGKELTKVEKCIDMPNPELSFCFFNNQINILVSAFKEDKLNSIIEFYEKLKHIKAVLQQLRELGDELGEDLRAISYDEKRMTDVRERNAKKRFK